MRTNAAVLSPEWATVPENLGDCNCVFSSVGRRRPEGSPVLREDGRWGSRKVAGMVVDRLDVSLEDTELRGEVELTVQLILAANDAECRLSRDEVDRILGLGPR